MPLHFLVSVKVIDKLPLMETDHSFFIIDYYNNRTMRYKIPVVKGLPQGEVFEWYNNGNIRAKMVYNNGKLDKGTTYTNDGNINELFQINSDGPNIITTFIDGKIRSICLFKYNRHKIEHYDNNGKIKSIIPYIDGKKNGLATYYFDNRRIICQFFKNGKL